MAVDRGKALLRNGITTLAENKVRLLAGVPGSPVRKTLPVRISEFRKVRPVGLHDLRELVVRRSERQPTERVSLKRAEDVRKFQRVEGAELPLTLSWNRTIEPVDECAPPSARCQCSLRSDGTCAQDVVARLIDGGLPWRRIRPVYVATVMSVQLP